MNSEIPAGDQPFHFTGQVGALYTDSDRNMRDNDVWWSLGFGYFFTDNFSLDLEYDTFKGTWNDYASVQPGVTYDKWGLKNYGLMARYYFTDWPPRVTSSAGAPVPACSRSSPSISAAGSSSCTATTPTATRWRPRTGSATGYSVPA